MKQTTELKKLFNEMKNKIEHLQADGKHEEAAGLLGEFTKVKNQLQVAQAMEDAEANVFHGSPVNGLFYNQEQRAAMNNRIFNKQVLGRSFTQEEVEYMNAVGTPGQVESTDGKGGYLVPEEQLNTIYEYRRSLASLKSLCRIMKTSTLTGTLPVESNNEGTLIDFDELEEISQSDLDFLQRKWTVSAKGAIIPISNSLLQDENVRLLDYVGRQFTKKAVRTENKDILNLLGGLKKTPMTGYKSLRSAINKTLDPDIAITAKIITNQTGFDYLDTLEDKNGRPLMYQDLTDNTVKRFAGLPIVILSDAQIENNGTKAPFYVGDLEEYCAFVDRTGLEIAVSTEAGFTRNATLLRAIERYAVMKLDEEAMALLEVDTVATGA